MNISDLKKIKTYNCYENNILYPFCLYKNSNCSPYFWNSISFKYESSDYSILKSKMMLGELPDNMLNTIINNFCNIEIIEHNDLKIFLNDINSLGIAGFSIDSYHLYWSEYYKKLHRYHCVLVTSINSENQILDCHDPFLSCLSKTLKYCLLQGA